MRQSVLRVLGLAMLVGAVALSMTPETGTSGAGGAHLGGSHIADGGNADGRAPREPLQDSPRDRDIVPYGVAIVLIALLARIGLLARETTLVLRRTIDFQTAVARAGNRLLVCRPEETSSRIVEALAILGEGLGTDHCYVLMLDGQAHLWSRAGLEPPAGWPAAQTDLIPDVAVCPEDLVFVEAANRIGPAALLEASTARGVASWTCARLRREGRIVGLLCFERSSSRLPAWPRRSRSFLQLVCDSFGAALEREHGWVQRREVEAALRRARRLEAIGTSTCGVAHNINNVLNVILGHAEMAADALPEGSHADHQIELIVQACGRAREIATQILEFGRRRRLPTRATSMDAVVAETIAQFGGSTTARVRFAGSAESACVAGEPAQLQQVVLNLLRNAAEASPPGETIDMRLDTIILAQPLSLSHGELRAGGHVRLRVADGGRGMDEGTLTRIFEPFFTTRPNGTGLGLATAFEFVREQAGAFDVRSAPGAGSMFEVWLPMVPRSLAADRESRARGTIMVVGRTEALVHRDEDRLATLGFEPIGFVDPEAALAALRTAPERFDLLIVEDELASLTGRVFVERAVRIAAKPIILSVATHQSPAAEGLSSIPAVDITCRPWRSDGLAALLSKHLAPAAFAASRDRIEAVGTARGRAIRAGKAIAERTSPCAG